MAAAAAAVSPQAPATSQVDQKLESAALKYVHLVVKVANFNTWAQNLRNATIEELQFRGAILDLTALTSKLEDWQNHAAETISFQVSDLLKEAYKGRYTAAQLGNLHALNSLDLQRFGELVNKEGLRADLLPTLHTEMRDSLLHTIGAALPTKKPEPETTS